MAYFKIGATDFSNITSGLQVSYKHKYKARDNALGNTIVDYYNRKRVITVTIIPVNDTQMQTLLNAIDAFNVSIQILEPKTKALATITATVGDYSVAYYTIQQTKTTFQQITLTFNEL